jgi:hypothetical protein
MSGPAEPDNATADRRPRARLALSGAILFGLAYTQARLYYSNQNQYFLHGLAAAGVGHLDEDWLARTADPTPAFSAVVEFTYRHLNEQVFYLYYFLILGLYCWSMIGVFDAVAGRTAGRAGPVLFVALLVAVHSGLSRWLSVRAFGVDYPVYFQSGVAAQYILRFGLQPSVGGVFLVVSLFAWLRERVVAAAALAGLAAVIHPTYLLIAAIVTMAYLLALVRERRFRQAAVTGLTALLVVVPVVVWTLRHFGPTTPEAFAESQRLLARFRIPHHTSIRAWCDGIALLQVAWIVAGIWLSRGTRLFGVLAIAFGISIGLTLLQLAVDSDTLALLFPWRTSAILVPVATTIVLTRIVQRVGRWIDRRPANLGVVVANASAFAVVGLGFAGMAITVLGLGYKMNADELPLLDYVKKTVHEKEVYLIPANIPKLDTAPRGASAGDFTPPPRGAAAANQIAVDLQRFRLYTGAPIYVDFKSVPYKDVEVLEWRRRLFWATTAYQSRNWDESDILAEAVRQGITHVVTTADRDIQCRRFEKVYEDRYYRVYHILGEAP